LRRRPEEAARDEPFWFRERPRRARFGRFRLETAPGGALRIEEERECDW
jgi:hypothetical protein